MGVEAFEALSKWRERLLDVSKRNRLISCRTSGKAGIVLLEHPAMRSIWDRAVLDGATMLFPWKRDILGESEQTGIDQPDSQNGEEGDAPGFTHTGKEETKHADDFAACLESGELDGADLLTHLSDKALGGRLQRLALNAQTSLQEQGVCTLYLAFGLLRWYESKDSTEPLQAPLLLVPVSLSRSSLDSPWELSVAEEEVIPNYCLVQMLADSFDLQLPAVSDEALLENRSGLDEFIEGIRAAVAKHERWSVEESVILGIFTFQKIAMWQDLGDNRERIQNHALCNAMATGDLEAPSERLSAPRAHELDDVVSPRDTFHILEADSSQHEAIEAVKQGWNLVLDGPPGTGKSQTIANIIAECLAMGKTVLFVSEKAAALEVVKRRLDIARLGDFCLECHSHKANKKQVVAELGRCLRLEPESYESRDHRLEELRRVRQQLNSYVRALHRQYGNLHLTPYQVHGRLAHLAAQSSSRYVLRDPLAVTAATLQEMVDAVRRLSECRTIITERGNHPWRGCSATSRSLALEDDIRHHFDLLARALPEYLSAFSPLCALGILGQQPTMHDLEAGLALARAASAYPTVPADWFAGDATAIGRAYVQLHDLAQDYQQLRQTLPQYTDQAIDADMRTWLSSMDAGATPLRTLGLVPVGRVRECLDRYQRVSPQLATLVSAVDAVDHLLAQTVAQLRAPQAGKLSLRMLPTLADVMELLARVGPVPRSWFESLRRQEIREIAERGQSEASYLADERKQLSELFAPAAFDVGAKAVLTSAMPFQSLFKRLLPRWRGIRKQVMGLYRQEAPSATSALLRDAARLLAYHQRQEKLRDLGKSLKEDLRATELGSVQWDAVLEDLRVIEQLEATVKLPEPSKSVLSQNAIDKEALRVLASTFKERLLALEQGIATFKSQFGLTLSDNLGISLRDRSSGDVLLWLKQAHLAVEQQQQVLCQIATVLRPAMDVEFARCRQHADDLAVLRSRRTKVRQVFGRLHAVEDDHPTPEDGKWEQKAELAKWLLAFVQQYGEHVPPPLVLAASDSTVRTRIQKAVEHIDSLRSKQFVGAWEFVCGVFPTERKVSNGIVLNTAPIADLVVWLRHRASDVTRLAEWIAFQRATTSLDQLGLSALADEITQQTVDVQEAVDAFLVRFYRLWLDAAYASDSALDGFRVDEHERLITRFRELDQEHIREGSKRIRAKQLKNALGLGGQDIGAPDSSELGVLLREVNKRRRHLPLRQLFKRIPSLLRKLKPCMMMSPLAVSTFLDSDDLHFDLVIFDEASQVRPHDAICAVYRAAQLVVAGDQKQLPPTSFFERKIDSLDDDVDEEDIDGTSDFESILDVCATLKLPRKRLQWHYRSRRESLIAFSNENFYDRELVTFPSARDVDGQSGVRFEWVADGRWQSGSSGGFNAREAEKTADLVFEHIRNNAGQSLGVITMNQRQQMLVIEEIETRRRAYPELEEFFSESRNEPFFVKNLENVQGDERDVIFLSISYAPPTDGGQLAMRFGPLNVDGGERRLNVAVTRARCGLTLISSIRANDIDPTRTNAIGVRLLRDYLDYAERGVAALKSSIHDDGNGEAESPFEECVSRELKKRGYEVRHQVGCGRYRIDLALVDPSQRGRYVLGIECDGATYHGSATARDRDRLRQSVLEEMGWRICRIWSTDWIRDPDRQTARVIAEYEQALRSAPEEAKAQQPEPKTVGEAKPVPCQAKGASRSALPQLSYQRIEDVPQDVIADLVRRLLDLHGATDRQELIVTVARRLGFERTGSKIKAQISTVIRTLLRRSRLVAAEDGRLRIADTAGGDLDLR